MATIGTAFAPQSFVTSPSMPRRRVLAPLAIAVLSTTFGGCSFAFVNGPPPNHRTSPFFACTSSNGVPMLDTIAASIGLLDAASFATGSASNSNTTGSRTGDAIVLGAGAALLATSAAYGFKKTSECREAEEELLRRTPVTPQGPFGARAPAAPQGPYDPWVAHPPAPTAAPQVPAAPATTPAADSSPWDGATPGK